MPSDSGKRSATKHAAKAAEPGLNPGSFNRAVVILRTLAQNGRRGTSLRDIIVRTGLPRPTVHRVLGMLLESSWIERGEHEQFYLGRDLACLGLVAMARHSLQRIAEQALARLAREIQQTVYLNLRVGDEAVCIARHEPENPIHTLVLQVGAREALGIGAGGMAILAALDKSEARAIIEINMRRYKQRSNFKEQSFRDALELARRRGYAAHDGLFRRGISGIGVAVGDAASQPLAAISTAFISDWLDQGQRDHCADLLQSTAARISRALSLAEH